MLGQLYVSLINWSHLSVTSIKISLRKHQFPNNASLKIREKACLHHGAHIGLQTANQLFFGLLVRSIPMVGVQPLQLQWSPKLGYLNATFWAWFYWFIIIFVYVCMYVCLLAWAPHWWLCSLWTIGSGANIAYVHNICPSIFLHSPFVPKNNFTWKSYSFIVFHQTLPLPGLWVF